MKRILSTPHCVAVLHQAITQLAAPEIVGSERSREQLDQSGGRARRARVNEKLTPSVFEEQLATSAARRDRFAVARDDRDRHDSASALTNEIAQQ